MGDRPRRDSKRSRRSVAAYIAVAAAMLVGGLPASAYDRPGTTTLVSVRRGRPANGDSQGAVLSGNGRFVAFESQATNLTFNDGNESTDVFRMDLKTRKIQLVSFGLNGLPGIGVCDQWESGSRLASISASGRYVSFDSCATNLVGGDSNGVRDVFIADMAKHTMRRVSVTSTGKQAIGPSRSSNQALSADSHYVALYGSRYVGPETPPEKGRATELLVHDVYTGRNEFVWSDWTGGLHTPNCDEHVTRSNGPVISGNGRFLAFYSDFPGLDPKSKDDGTVNVYVYDRETNRSELINLTPEGEKSSPPNPLLTECNNLFPHINFNGRFVAYMSSDPYLVPNDSNGTFDVFVRDRRTDRTERISVDPYGRELEGASSTLGANLARDGLAATFTYSPVDNEEGEQTFIHDRTTGATELISSAADGDVPNGDSTAAFMTDGRSIVFDSTATNLVSRGRMFGCGSGCGRQIFLRDRGDSFGANTGDKVGSRGIQSSRPTNLCFGRFRCIPPHGATSTKDRRGDVSPPARKDADLIGVTLANRPAFGDMLVRQKLKTLSIRDPYDPLRPNLIYGLDFKINGSRFQVRIQRTLGLDFNLRGGASFGLFKMDATTKLYKRIAALKGGYGTTGEEIVVSLPLDHLGLQRRRVLTHVEVFSALGMYNVGPARILDRIRIK